VQSSGNPDQADLATTIEIMVVRELQVIREDADVATQRIFTVLTVS
jgi:hypothetical protein